MTRQRMLVSACHASIMHELATSRYNDKRRELNEADNNNNKKGKRKEVESKVE